MDLTDLEELDFDNVNIPEPLMPTEDAEENEDNLAYDILQELQGIDLNEDL